MDSTKSAFADARHRLITHNSYYVGTVIELIFGVVAINSDGKEYSPRDVAEVHCQEDFKGTIPTLDDWLSEVEYRDWMGGTTTPPSHRKIAAKRTTTFTPFKEKD